MVDYSKLVTIIDIDQSKAIKQIEDRMVSEPHEFSIAQLCFHYRIAMGKSIDPSTGVGGFLADHLYSAIKGSTEQTGMFPTRPFEECLELALMYYENSGRNIPKENEGVTCLDPEQGDQDRVKNSPGSEYSSC